MTSPSVGSTESSDGRLLATGSSLPRLEPFAAGQVYSASRGQQVHVLASSAPGPADRSATDTSLS